MAGLVRMSLRCMLVMSLLYVGTKAEDLNTCEKVQPCLKYRESASCDSEGKREVCFTINNAAECLLDGGAPDIVANFCFANGGGSSTVLQKASGELCTTGGVVGGQNLIVGIQDGTMLATPFDKVITDPILGYSGANPTCKGYEDVCGAAAVDIRLVFTVSTCDPTTTVTTPTTATTVSTVTTVTTVATPAPCSTVCTAWVAVVPDTCRVTCGTGLELYTRTCGTATYCQVQKYFTCTRPACVSRVDGAYGFWNQWGQCSATCLPAQRTRTRECNNPMPQNGGSQCSGTASEIQYSCPYLTACPAPTAPPTVPPVTVGPGRPGRRRGRGRRGRRYRGGKGGKRGGRRGRGRG